METKKLLSLACVFSMLLSFFNVFFVCEAQKTTYKVAVIGDAKSGKTQIYNRLLGKHYHHNSYTPSTTVTTHTIEGPGDISVNFYITPGDEQYRDSQVIPYVKEADLVLITANMTYTTDSMESVTKPWVDLTRKENPNAELGFIGTKKDYNESYGYWQSKKNKIEELYSGCKCIVTSAKNNDGIQQDLVDFVLDKAKSKVQKSKEAASKTSTTSETATKDKDSSTKTTDATHKDSTSSTAAKAKGNSTSFKIIVLSAITTALLFGEDIYNAGKAAVRWLIGSPKSSDENEEQKTEQTFDDNRSNHERTKKLRKASI